MAFDKDYITDTCDLLVAALSNRTRATMTIFQYREESKRHAPITPKPRRLAVIPMYTSTGHEEESDSVLTCDREIRMPGRNCVAQTCIILLVYVYMCWKFLCGPTLWRNVETMLSNWGPLSWRMHYCVLLIWTSAIDFLFVSPQPSSWWYNIQPDNCYTCLARCRNQWCM